MTATNEPFSYTVTIADTTPDVTVVTQLFQHLTDWVAAHPEYRLQSTTIQYDVVRYPRSGGAYGEIIWYAEEV